MLGGGCVGGCGRGMMMEVAFWGGWVCQLASWGWLWFGFGGGESWIKHLK